MANNLYERLAKTEGGEEKIRKLRDTKLIRHPLRDLYSYSLNSGGSIFGMPSSMG